LNRSYPEWMRSRSTSQRQILLYEKDRESAFPNEVSENVVGCVSRCHHEKPVANMHLCSPLDIAKRWTRLFLPQWASQTIGFNRRSSSITLRCNANRCRFFPAHGAVDLPHGSIARTADCRSIACGSGQTLYFAEIPSPSLK
jgi:hypothetical protein